MNKHMVCPVQFKDVTWAGGSWHGADSMEDLRWDALCKIKAPVPVGTKLLPTQSRELLRERYTNTKSGATKKALHRHEAGSC